MAVQEDIDFYTGVRSFADHTGQYNATIHKAIETAMACADTPMDGGYRLGAYPVSTASANLGTTVVSNAVSLTSGFEAVAQVIGSEIAA